MSINVTALDHVNIECKDVDETAKFYTEILGMTSGERPVFPRPGHWMYLADRPVIHLITPDPKNAMLTGSHDAAISHFALRVSNFEETMKHLDSQGISYHAMPVPGTNMRQLFFDDPNGVLVELIHIPN